MTRWLLAAWLIAGTAAAQEQPPAGRGSGQDAPEGRIRVDIKLKNKSNFRGFLEKVDAFLLKTRYGLLKIPLKETRSIQWGRAEKEERDTIRTNQGTFTGWIQNQENFVVDTGFGVLRIPPDQIRYLRVIRGEISEDFETDSLDHWEVKQGNWTVTDGRLQATCSSNYHNQLHWAEELEGTYTLEVSTNGWSQVGVVWNARSTSDAYVLWINGRYIQVFGGPNWWNRDLARWQMNVPRGSFYKIRLEVEDEKTTVTVAGTRLGTVTTDRTRGHAGLFLYNGTAQFDDFRIEE